MRSVKYWNLHVLNSWQEKWRVSIRYIHGYPSGTSAMFAAGYVYHSDRFASFVIGDWTITLPIIIAQILANSFSHRFVRSLNLNTNFFDEGHFLIEEFSTIRPSLSFFGIIVIWLVCTFKVSNLEKIIIRSSENCEYAIIKIVSLPETTCE